MATWLALVYQEGRNVAETKYNAPSLSIGSYGDEQTTPWFMPL